MLISLETYSNYVTNVSQYYCSMEKKYAFRPVKVLMTDLSNKASKYPLSVKGGGNGQHLGSVTVPIMTLSFKYFKNAFRRFYAKS